MNTHCPIKKCEIQKICIDDAYNDDILLCLFDIGRNTDELYIDT